MEAKVNLTNLNDKQHDAVISADRRLLVLAGAGSGKTKTLIQKLIYLTDEGNVSPANILAITFTKNATNEMIDRLIMSADESGLYESLLKDKSKNQKEKNELRNSYVKKYKWIENFTIRTFHSLCYSILRNHGVREFDNKFKIISDTKSTEEDFNSQMATETSFDVFHKILIELSADRLFLLNLKKYILDYIIDKIHFEKDSKVRIATNGKFYTTLRGEKVRSKSEQHIADWMYRHSIQYQYEPSVNFKDFPFNPDFYIPEADLFVEHVSNKSFPMKEKEEQFQVANRLCFKTYESMTEDSTLFNLALDRIIKNRLPANYHHSVALSYEEEFKSYQDHVFDFLRQVMRVTDMIKVDGIDLNEVEKRASEDQHERVRDFYKLALPLIKRYQSYCVNKSYLDFNDLITTTISLFKNQPEIAELYKKRFQYILVDEFQDVNNLQVDLIKLMLTDESQLFCVGDDWQSIYGFRGSNVNYIVEFEKHFANSKTIKLNLNYRSTENIVDASNEVIKLNKFKVEKEVKASKRSENKIEIFVGKDSKDNVEYALNKVKELIKEGIPNEEILFLYRRTKMYKAFSDRFWQEKVRVNFKTIHAAKGLEAKVVFIIGLTDGSGGFPDIWLEDRIFQVVKSSDYDLLLEEERRLFYVALTRAKDKLFLITEKGNESSFLKEIPSIYTVKVNIPMKSVVEKVVLCNSCESALDNRLFVFCPYCGEKQEAEKVLN